MPHLQVITTTACRDEAERLARALVAQRLAACVQIEGPITSVYWWQDQIETAQEWRLAIKTRDDLFTRLAGEIAELHSYDTPEIVALPLGAVSEAYRAWLDAELEPPV